MNDIIEAIETGENPNMINPSHRAKIEGGELGYEPLLPGGSETTQAIASAAYQRAMDKLRRYVPANRIPRHEGQFPGLLMGMMQTIQQIKQVEDVHCEYLEMLAVDTVLNLPEFDAAKQAVANGDLKIDAQLVRMIANVSQMREEDREEVEEIEQAPDFESQLAQALVDMDQEKMKRRFQNIMAQGAAANYMYLYELSRNELNGMNPRLADMYGFMQSVGDMAMWVLPNVAQGGQKAGEAEVTQEEETGAGVIKARAIIFPLLIHEIVKGLIEYVNSHGLSTIPATRDEVLDAVDKPEHEVYDLMLGPIFWKKLQDAMDPNSVKLLLHVWSKITTLPAFDADIKGSFAEFIKEFLRDPESAKRIVHSFTQDVKRAIDRYEAEQDSDTPTFESYSYKFIMEALTNRMASVLQHYNASLAASDPSSPDRQHQQQPMTEEEMEQWAAVDPSGQKAINLPVIMDLKKEKLIKSPKDIVNIIKNTTYIPVQTEIVDKKKKLTKDVPYPPEVQLRYFEQNKNQSLPWVLKQMKRKNIKYPEDLPDVKDTLNTFYRYKDKTNLWDPDAPRDLYSYATFADLAKVTQAMTLKLFGDQMEKRATIRPDTMLVGIEPPYELIRILPTREGQKSLYEYAQVGGNRYAAWCVAYEPKSGWSYFSNYLKLNQLAGFRDIQTNPRNPPQEIIDNPMHSFYYVAKDGLPWAAFEFQSNYFMNVRDSENRTDPDYNKYIKPMIMKYLPFARNIVEPQGIARPPSVMLKDYIIERPKELAAFIVCKLKSIATANQKNPFVDVKDELTAKNSAIEMCQELNTVLRDAFKQKDDAWRTGLNTWAKYSTSGLSRTQNIHQTDDNADKKVNIDTPEVRDALIHYLLNPDMNCAEMGDLALKFKDALEQKLMRIELERSQGIEESVKKNQESVGEGVISKALGTAAMIGALGMGAPIHAKTNNTAPSSVQSQNLNKRIQHNIIARTLWAEARENSEEGMRAVASVIYNRGGGNLEEMIKEIKSPKQFSCWNSMTWKDWRNFKLKYKNGKEWEMASEIAYEMINGTFKRLTSATHYYNPRKAKPSWAYTKNELRPHFRVGDHIFMTIG